LHVFGPQLPELSHTKPHTRPQGQTHVTCKRHTAGASVSHTQATQTPRHGAIRLGAVCGHRRRRGGRNWQFRGLSACCRSGHAGEAGGRQPAEHPPASFGWSPLSSSVPPCRSPWRRAFCARPGWRSPAGDGNSFPVARSTLRVPVSVADALAGCESARDQ
jgi:hypothetical protein